MSNDEVSIICPYCGRHWRPDLDGFTTPPVCPNCEEDRNEKVREILENRPVQVIESGSYIIEIPNGTATSEAILAFEELFKPRLSRFGCDGTS